MQTPSGDHSDLSRVERVRRVYSLLLHEPYTAPEHPVPINATIVNARTFLHSSVPQPTGRLLYAAFGTHREQDELVPLSSVTAEVGGNLSAYAPRWETAVEAVVRLARTGECDAMSLGLPSLARALLAAGPETTLTPHGIGVGMGGQDRAAILASLASQMRAVIDGQPLSPGF